MSKCLKTKIDGVVSDDSLLKLNEFRIETTGNAALELGLETLFDFRGILATVSIVDGDVSFTDGSKTLDIQNEKGKKIKTGKTFVLSVSDKRAIRGLSLNGNNTSSLASAFCDFSNNYFLPYLTRLQILNGAKCKGLRLLLKEAVDFSSLYVVSGDLGGLRIDEIPTTVKSLSFTSAKGVIGKIADFKRFSLNEKTDLWNLFNGSTIEGDLADVHQDAAYINFPSYPVTWTRGKRTNCTLLAFYYLSGGHFAFASDKDVENMFLDQATCTFKGASLSNQHGGSVAKLVCTCKGTFTPSPEAQQAIKAIYAKGITEIIVNKVNMEQYKE